jgi:group I intron endonuclease
MAIVYLVTNLMNHKKYIGADKNNNPNYFGSGVKIKSAIKKYGKNNFKKEIIEECDDSDLYAREKYWIDYYDAVNSNDFYNLAEGGRGGNQLNNPEVFEKWKKNIPDISKYSKERKGKTYEELYGDRANDEKEKRRNSLLGKKHSQERRKKESLSHRGKTVWNKGLNKTDERVRKNIEDRCRPNYYKTYTLLTPDNITLTFNGKKELVKFITNENKKYQFKSRINVDKLIILGEYKNYKININEEKS